MVNAPPQPDRVIVLRLDRRDFLEKQQEIYRARSLQATKQDVKEVLDDTYYKIVVLGILLKHGEVTIGEAFDEISSTDGVGNVDLSLLENVFKVICAYNNNRLQSLVRVFENGSQSTS